MRQTRALSAAGESVQVPDGSMCRSECGVRALERTLPNYPVVNQRTPDHNGGWRALSWSWSPLEWAWLPSMGPYRWPLGGPSRVVSIRVDTRHVTPAERFDLWRDVTRHGYDYARIDQSTGQAFRASGVCFFSADGHLIISGSSPVAVIRSRQNAGEAGENVTIGYVVDGERLADSPGDALHKATPGGFFVDDSTRSLDAVYPARQRAAHLTVPRAVIAALFNGEAPPPSVLLAALNASRLAPVIRSQFATVALHGEVFNDMEGGAAMASLRSLVLTALEAAGEEAALELAAAPAIVIAARRHIEMHLGDPELGVDDIAQAVGCSRSTLYRVFAGADASVAETIRELRIDRLRRLLESEPISVAAAAERCGFSDPRTLQRQFKSRFGVSARDFQALARGV
jgi:AraC-like DNA-binding protein